MSQEAQRIEVEKLLRTKTIIADFPTGPLLDSFDPIRLAEALEQQATRAMLAFDVPKVDMRMDAEDALQLAAWLRQAPRK